MNNLRKLRYDAELSLRDLADGTGLIHTTINLLENDKRKFTSKHIAVLCAFFDVTSDYLLGRSDDGIGIYVFDTSFDNKEHRYVSENEYGLMKSQDGYSQRIAMNGNPLYAKGDEGEDYAITARYVARSLVLKDGEIDDAERKRREIEALLGNMTAKELDKTLRFIKEYIK